MFVRDLASFKNANEPSLGKFSGNIETPAPLLRTFLGNPLYTTPDAIDEINDPYLGQLDVVDIVYKDFGDIPLNKLCTKISAVQHVLSARPSGGKTGDSNCDANGMSIDSHCGRKQLNVANYLSRIKIENPKVVVALADEINVTLGKKRLTKAIERTANWFQLLSQGINADGADPENKPFLFGVAQYDRTYPVQLPLLVKHMTSNGAGGIVIGNSHLGESAEVRTETVMAIKALLSAEIPTMIQGADSLQEIILSLQQGLDLISTNYPQTLSSFGLALAIDLKLLEVNTTGAPAVDTKKRALDDVAVDDSATKDTKKQRVSTSDTTDSTGAPVKPVTESTPSAANSLAPVNSQAAEGLQKAREATKARWEVNLWDPVYRRDTRALVPGCTCHACRHHSRAYIHHLHLSREILAEVLLYHHNVHQTLALFAAARNAIRNDCFDAWLRSIQDGM